MKKIQIWNWSASILTLIWFSLAAHLYHTFTEQEKVVRGESARLANALQMQISRILESVDIALLSVAQRIADQPRTPGEIQTLLLNERKSLPPYFSLAFIDAQGIGVAASEPGFKPGASYADRDYFVAHRVSGQKLFVGGPLRGRTLGKQFFATSRRVETIDGQWIGVLMGSIEPYLMAEIFAEFPQGTNGSIELANTRTKQIVARHPNHEKHFAQDISKSALFSGVLDRPSGTYEVPTTTDGIARVIAYHQTPKAPFVSLVSYARQDLRNEFFNMTIAYTAIGLLFSLIIIAFARLFQRNQVERERQFVVESELTLARQSQARMEIERTAQMERFLQFPRT